jgi:hypothetical protein
VIHAEEISSPGAAAVTRGREASTNPARPNPRRRRIAPRIGPGWRQSARSGGGWPRGSGRRRESRALGFGGRANTRRKEEIDAGQKKRREKQKREREVRVPRYVTAGPGRVWCFATRSSAIESLTCGVRSACQAQGPTGNENWGVGGVGSTATRLLAAAARDGFRVSFAAPPQPGPGRFRVLVLSSLSLSRTHRGGASS